MEKMEYEILIDAKPAKVWDSLWEDQNYRTWTSAFSEGSNAVTDWKEGSKILFLDGKGSGMISEVAKKNEPEYMSIRHLGIVKDGKEILEGKEIDEWKGAMENYTLKKENGKVRLVVDIDVDDKWKSYFNETWPKALTKLKEIAENQ